MRAAPRLADDDDVVDDDDDGDDADGDSARKVKSFAHLAHFQLEELRERERESVRLRRCVKYCLCLKVCSRCSGAIWRPPKRLRAAI